MFKNHLNIFTILIHVPLLTCLNDITSLTLLLRLAEFGKNPVFVRCLILRPYVSNILLRTSLRIIFNFCPCSSVWLTELTCVMPCVNLAIPNLAATTKLVYKCVL